MKACKSKFRSKLERSKRVTREKEEKIPRDPKDKIKGINKVPRNNQQPKNRKLVLNSKSQLLIKREKPEEEH